MIRLPCTPDEILDMDGRDVIEELFDELDMPVISEQISSLGCGSVTVFALLACGMWIDG